MRQGITWDLFQAKALLTPSPTTTTHLPPSLIAYATRAKSLPNSFPHFPPPNLAILTNNI
jgi:hypothetical protein